MPSHPSSRAVRTWIEISTRSLFHNYACFRWLARGVPVMAVVKSNAYGHGLVLTAKALATLPSFWKSGWFGVDSIVEALRLRREGIHEPILVLGYTLPGRYADAARHGITVTISNFESLGALGRAKARPAFHLKIDTGMHRLGFQVHEMARLADTLRSSRLSPQGVFSHFAAADKRAASRRQMALFDRCRTALARAGIKPNVVHLAKTEGILFHPESRHDLVRLGIGLYGYLPGPASPAGRRQAGLTKSRTLEDERLKLRLRPVMTWKTIVSEVKRVRKGERIGYDLTERLRRNTDVAILPVGYWHGFDRGLSSVGEVLVHGKRCRVLGRVSMDMTAVDVTGLRGASIGDEVVLIGRQGREFIDAHEMAGKIGTTCYEVLTRVNPLIRRIPS